MITFYIKHVKNKKIKKRERENENCTINIMLNIL